jgi:NADPH2:quinone reductase
VAAFLVGLTALSLVNDAFPVQKRDKVLVHAAAGGLGLVLIQVLKQKGATVIGTAGGAEKCQLAKRCGADFMVDYRSEVNWVEEVTKFTAGEGLDVVCAFIDVMLH